MSHEQHSKARARLPRPWLLVARLILLAISVLALLIYLVGTPVYFAQLLPSSHHCFVDCPTSANIRECQEAGLVWGKELYFDGTKVAANASSDSLTPRFAIEAHLVNLFEPETEEPLQETEQTSSLDAMPPETGKQEETTLPNPLPVALSPEEREELSQHNAERHDWIEQVGAQDRQVSSRGYQRLADLRVSTTDPDATLMPTSDGRPQIRH